MRHAVCPRPWQGMWLAWVVALAFALNPSLGHADAVDDAYAAGRAAARDARWADAIVELERTRSLLGVSDATLAYDLGTVYAEADQLGHAVWHLRTALRLAEDDTIREAARRNLSVVRRRMDLRAEVAGTRTSSFDGLQRRLRRLLSGGLVRWLAVGIGTAFAIALFLRSWISRYAQGRRSGLVALVWALGVGFFALCAASLMSAGGAPEAVVLGDAVQVHDGAGAHHSTEFSVQGGSVVRVLSRAPGWR